MAEQNKRYGIRGVLTADHPLRGAHLLGESWHWERWYASAQERDQAFEDMLRKHPYYRLGDHPQQALSKLER